MNASLKTRAHKTQAKTISSQINVATQTNLPPLFTGNSATHKKTSQKLDDEKNSLHQSPKKKCVQHGKCLQEKQKQKQATKTTCSVSNAQTKPQKWRSKCRHTIIGVCTFLFFFCFEAQLKWFCKNYIPIGSSEGYAHVFCATSIGNELDCLVDVFDQKTVQQCVEEYDSKPYAYCGGWEIYRSEYFTAHITQKTRTLTESIRTDGGLCSRSQPCLFVDAKALVLAAAEHKRTAGGKQIDKLRYRFNVDNDWKPHQPRTTSEPIEMKITTSMLTTAGFTSVGLGSKKIPKQLEKKKKSSAFYVGISGGGFRALSGHMGAFRGLSTQGDLSTVTMFSSVSGGTWFLTKLGFEPEFAENVLGNSTPITDVVFKWFESEYFRKLRTAHRVREEVAERVISSFVTEMVAQAPGPIKAALGNTMSANDYFNFSWQAMVEQTILGPHIAHQTLANATLAAATQAKFGQNYTLAFNWNQLNQWESDNDTLWFLKGKPEEGTARWQKKKDDSQQRTSGDAASEQNHGPKNRETDHVQHPVYTSALYKQSSDGTHEVEITAQGKPMEELFQVCQTHKYKHNLDLRYDTGGTLVETFRVVTGTIFVSYMMVSACSLILRLQRFKTFMGSPVVIIGIVILGLGWYTEVMQITRVLECLAFIGAIVSMSLVVNYSRSFADMAFCDSWDIMAVGMLHKFAVRPMCAIAAVALLSGADHAFFAGLTYLAVVVLDKLGRCGGRYSPIVYLSSMCSYVWCFALAFNGVPNAFEYWLLVTFVMNPLFLTILATCNRLTGRVIAMYASALVCCCIPYGFAYWVVVNVMWQWTSGQAMVVLLVPLFSAFFSDAGNTLAHSSLWPVLAGSFQHGPSVTFALTGSLMAHYNAEEPRKTLTEVTPSKFKGLWTLPARCAEAPRGKLETASLPDEREGDRRLPDRSHRLQTLFHFYSFAGLSNWFAICLWCTAGFLIRSMVFQGKTFTAVYSELLHPKEMTDCTFNFDFNGLTIGQVASASSAAMGGGAVRPWTENVVMLVRQHCSDYFAGQSVGHCTLLSILVQRLSEDKVVIDEFLKLIGCKDEDATVTAAKWSKFLRTMAVKMNVSDLGGKNSMGHHMTFDAGYNDNSGLGPILAHYLASKSEQGQILVLVINELGDHQMETYFDSSAGSGGLICQDETTSETLDLVFDRIHAVHKNSFEAVGGKFVASQHENDCAFRLSRSAFFEGNPPQHHRFDDPKIPAHITYAFQENAVISENKAFYTMPKDNQKTVDLLFVIASAPVSTLSSPVGGAQSYAGTALSMEHAMMELSDKFPGFFGEEDTNV